MIICQLFDTRVKAPHGPIFTARTAGEAERIWAEMLKRDDLVAQYPEDFMMRCLGNMDRETGIIVDRYDPPHVMVRGVDHVKAEQMDAAQEALRLERSHERDLQNTEVMVNDPEAVRRVEEHVNG